MNHTITISIIDPRHNLSWNLTGVYGPQGDLEKKMFTRELRQLKQFVGDLWLLIGDFNLIYKEQDKNNSRINRRLMLRFRRALNHLEVKDIQLMGGKYTWSNQQQEPTMTRIDRVFLYSSMGRNVQKSRCTSPILFNFRPLSHSSGASITTSDHTQI
jgi:hypothetical protein